MEIANSKEAIIKRMVELYSDGKSAEEVADIVNRERKNTMFTSKSIWVKEAKKYAIMQIIIPEKEYFLKESLEQYEEIKDESKLIEERDKGLNIQLKALKDRNELLGLTNGQTLVQINFDSKNMSDDDFLASQNKPKKDILDV